ncbi:hypothetical protein SD457_16700 [Coprobacillaceae bacterium CR2/5/TPMF4]|nr:hypothetical protein SD457_16700 [Coprobacillaceae bacterium CR2/5/TPMF4]
MSIYERKRKMDQFPSILLFMMDIKLMKRKLCSKRKYKTFSPPKDIGIRKARKMAKEIETEMQFQFEKQQNLGSEKGYLKFGIGIKLTTLQII